MTVPMLVLRTSPTSPFVRKVRIAVDVVGLTAKVQIQDADTMSANDSLGQQNPLGKIPTLILEDGSALYDSRVIVAYLDEITGGGQLIPRGPERFEVLRREALADGIMDAGVLRYYETRFRAPEKHEQSWLDHQALKMERGLDALEAMNLAAPTAKPDIAEITIACMLAWLDRRFPGWRPSRPKLAAWVDEFARVVPSFEATKPPPL